MSYGANEQYLNEYMDKLEKTDTLGLTDEEREKQENAEQAQAFISGFLSDVKDLPSGIVEFAEIEEQCNDWLDDDPLESDDLYIYFDNREQAEKFVKTIDNPNDYISYIGFQFGYHCVKVER